MQKWDVVYELEIFNLGEATIPFHKPELFIYRNYQAFANGS